MNLDAISMNLDAIVMNLDAISMNFDEQRYNLGSFLTFSSGLFGWGGGWLEKSDVKLISTQVVVEVEVWVELGKKNDFHIQNHIQN